MAKFVRNRKVYDTDTAEEIYSWEEPFDPDAFSESSYTEVLYRTANDTLFLHLERHSDIELMDDDDAAAWLDKKNASVEAYKTLDIELQEG